MPNAEPTPFPIQDRDTSPEEDLTDIISAHGAEVIGHLIGMLQRPGTPRVRTFRLIESYGKFARSFLGEIAMEDEGRSRYQKRAQNEDYGDENPGFTTGTTITAGGIRLTGDGDEGRIRQLVQALETASRIPGQETLATQIRAKLDGLIGVALLPSDEVLTTRAELLRAPVQPPPIIASSEDSDMEKSAS